MSDLHPYELVFITQPEIGTDELDSLVKKLKDIIQKHEGSIANEDRWGRRRLAYPIHGQREGYYDVLTFQSAAPAIAEIEHQLKVNDSIIRHLMIRVEKPKKKRKERKPKVAAAGSAPASASSAPARPAPRSPETPSSAS